MLKELKKRLILLYTGTTSLILTVILIITFIYQQSILNQKTLTEFQNLLVDLSAKLETDNLFSDNWLAKMESSNQAVIYIEENHVPLLFRGAWVTKTDRKILTEKAKKMGRKENIDTEKKPFASTIQRSSIFKIKGDHRDSYLGTILILSGKSSYKSLILLYDMSSTRKSSLFQGLFFLALDIIGIFALYLVSRYAVSRSLRPVSQYHKKQTDFVAAASHELRSPLAVIQASASAIQAAPDQQKALTDTIVRECVRAGSLVKNLLLLASADSDSLLLETSAFEIDTLLLNLYENYEPICQNKGISLHLCLPEDILPEITGNSQYIYQVLAILLDNAIAYGCLDKSSQSIDLQAECCQNHLLLSVIDHGKGIPDTEKDKIFDRFYRSDISRNKKEHFGLGLNIADELCRLMHTPLLLKDTPGGGCTFTLRIPL